MAPFEQAGILFPAKERKEGKGTRKGERITKGKGCPSSADLSGYTEVAGSTFAGLAELA